MDKKAQFISTLRIVPHFSTLTVDTQQALAAVAVHKHYDAGQVIYIEGEPAEAIYVLEAGWIKATRMSKDGREQAMMFLRPVEVFGDIAVLTGTTYPGTVITLEPVWVWAIPADKALQMAQHYPDLAAAIIRHLGYRVLHYIHLVEDLSLRSVEARLAHTLLEHSELREGRLIVPRQSWTTFDEMAVRLGTVRDVMGRTLRTLEGEGLIKVERREIVLLDPKGLSLRADS